MERPRRIWAVICAPWVVGPVHNVNMNVEERLRVVEPTGDRGGDRHSDLAGDLVGGPVEGLGNVAERVLDARRRPDPDLFLIECKVL